MEAAMEAAMEDTRSARDQSATREITVRLDDGGWLALRPLTYGERQPLLEVFRRMSGQSRAARYLTGIPRLTDQMVGTLAAVDGDRHVAWLACVGDNPVGIGRFVRWQGDPTVADFALEIVDEHQGRGIGRVLCDVLATLASAGGVRTITASVAADNRWSLRLLARLGATGLAEAGVVEARGSLRQLTPHVVDRHAVIAVAAAVIPSPLAVPA
jgi:L-amino acid N-acyltransferase YncA